jgi:hypothetical protein
LFNYFASDFFVSYFRGLHGFDFDGHLVTSNWNIAIFDSFGKGIKRSLAVLYQRQA